MTRAVATLAVVLVVLLAIVPGTAAAASRSGGTVVVGAGETVGEDLQAFGGTVVIRGTVDGDLEAFGGTVVIRGTVTGDVEATGGTVQVLGTVEGDLQASAGTVDLGETGQVNGTLSAAGGTIAIAGTVGGNARLAGDVTLAETAVIRGNLEYDGELTTTPGAVVEGTLTERPGLDVGPGGGVSLPTGAFTVYGALVTLALGAVLLLAFPAFSGGVARRVSTEPLRTAGIGLLAVIAVPVALILVAITVVGFPLSLAGGVAFALLAWIGSVYGRYAVGAWLLSEAGYENRWLALLVGVGLVALLRVLPIPFVGGLVRLAVFLLGFGALVHGLWTTYRSRRSDEGGAMIESEGPQRGEAGPGPA